MGHNRTIEARTPTRVRRQLAMLSTLLLTTLLFSQTFAQSPLGALEAPTQDAKPEVRESLPTPLWTDAKKTAFSANEPLRQGSFETIADQQRNAIVNIEVTLPENPYFPGLEPTGQGSGFVIHPQGYVLTNAHVVATATHINVTTSDRQVFRAHVVGLDSETDIALLRIDTHEVTKQNITFPILTLADSDHVRPGRWVIAIGNPYGLNHTVTAGIVSAVDRRTMSSQLRLRYTNFIQFDAAINLGNSGGPLLDMHGDVIGMNTALQRGNDLGFAIPSNMIREVLAQMLRGDMTRAWSGMALQDLTATDARKMPNGRDGARVVGVLKKSPAGRAEIHDGDVILAYNGQPVEDADQLRWWIAMSPRDVPQKLLVFRGGRQIQLDLVLEEEPQRERPPSREQKQPASAPEGPQVFEFVIGSAPADASDEDTPEPGVYVLWINPGSPAALAGLNVGDRITHLNDTSIEDPDAFIARAREISNDKPISLRARRGHQHIFIFFQPRERP